MDTILLNRYFGEMDDFLLQSPQRHRSLQISHKERAVTFGEITDNCYKYTLHYPRARSKVCELYNGFCVIEGKRFVLTDEQMQRFCDVYGKFYNDYASAINKADGFHSVTKDGNTIYFKRMTDFTYKFIAEYANGNLRQDRMEIWEYFGSFDFFGFFKQEMFAFRGGIEHRAAQIGDDFILLNTDDEYLNKEIKYICNRATKSDIAYLDSINWQGRFFAENKIYGIADIMIMGVGRVPPSFFNRSRRYWVYFTVEGREFVATYYYGICNKLFVINRICLKHDSIEISAELNAIINKKIEETDDGKYDSFSTSFSPQNKQ